MHILIKLIVTAATLLLVAYVVPGFAVASFVTALIVAVVLGLVNLIIKPIVVILTLPINIITLGLFTFVINALLLWFVASFIDGFSIDGFIPAFIGALLISVVSWIVGRFSKDD
ncbi:MAG: phage holin family protein [Patescibacteria group bacterium]